MSAGKIVLGVAGALGLALILSSFTVKKVNKPAIIEGGPEPIKGTPETPSLVKGTGKQIEEAIRNEGDGRPDNGESLSYKEGENVYSVFPRVYVYSRPTVKLKYLQNATKPFKKFDLIGEYGGPSAEAGWSKVYIHGYKNPYLFVKTTSITNVKTV